MRVGVQRNVNIRVVHVILQRPGVRAALCHVAKGAFPIFHVQVRDGKAVKLRNASPSAHLSALPPDEKSRNTIYLVYHSWGSFPSIKYIVQPRNGFLPFQIDITSSRNFSKRFRLTKNLYSQPLNSALPGLLPPCGVKKS